MSATQLGTAGLPGDPPIETMEWTRGVGETYGYEYRGERSLIESKYQQLKNEVGTSALTMTNQEGRCRLVARFAREDENTTGSSGVTIVEELYGADLVRSIFAAPTFRTLTDDRLAVISKAVAQDAVDAAISDYSAWTATEKELRWQMRHGQDTYYETTFVLRIRKQGVRSSALRGAFTNINAVVTVPNLTAGMTELVGALPSGEWLYKPPQVTYVGRGIWNVSTEYHWAVKWSVVYGGTMKGFL